MLSQKRQASSSPSRSRSHKRPAVTPSLEEGEVDDPSSTPAPAPIHQHGLPPKPMGNSNRTIAKIQYPFKKKDPKQTNIQPFNVLAPSTSSEPPRKDRDDDFQRGRPRNEARPRGGDHWEAGQGFGNRDRGRRSPHSPRRHSRSRSRSRDRHRLQPPDSNFSPLSKERSRSRERYDRHRESRDYRRHDDDRHYRPYDNREWTRRDDGDRWAPRRGEYRPPKTPPTPRPPSPPSDAPPPPSPPAPESIEPRPPAETPPPAPPPDPRLMNHAPMSFSVKKPLNHALPPKPAFNPMAAPPPPPPPSIPPQQPPQPPSSLPPQAPQHPPPQTLIPHDKSKAKEPPKVRIVRRRELSKRSAKQDMLSYGRFFKGCGEQSDYDVTTKLGEGTFGEVHKAINKKTGQHVALKRILMHHEKEGMPVTALREIKILKALKHPSIVNILDMFVVRSTEKDPLSVYMVFPYMDHDLAGLLENERVSFSPSQIKLYMKQLLEGTEYMHRNHILHRDMKAANLLISNKGILQIADFGLARSYDMDVTKGTSNKRYTNCVVTRWYRPPELLLGARQYGGEVDIWGIGCVLGEMFTRKPILPGTSDLDQLEKIWYLCGTPTQHTWPNFDHLPGCEGVKRFSSYARRVKPAYEHSVGPEMADLLDRLLVCNPKDRITASQALEHAYFWTDPLPADPSSLPTYDASHEFDKRGHRNHHAAALPHGGPPPLRLNRPQLAMEHPHSNHNPNMNMNGPGRPHPHPQPNLPPPPGPGQFDRRHGGPGGGGGGYGGHNHNHNNFGPGNRRPPYNQHHHQHQPPPTGPGAHRGGPPPGAPLGPAHQQPPSRPPPGMPGDDMGMMGRGPGGPVHMPPWSQGGGGGGGPYNRHGPGGPGGGPGQSNSYPQFPPHPAPNNMNGMPRGGPMVPGLPAKPAAPLGRGPGGGGFGNPNQKRGPPNVNMNGSGYQGGGGGPPGGGGRPPASDAGSGGGGLNYG